MLANYATVDDLEDGWRVLEPSEKEFASVLMGRACSLITGELHRNGINDLNNDGLQAAKVVACDMVRHAMVSGNNGASGIFGDSSDSLMWEQQPVGGSLYITAQHRRMLGLSDVRCGSVRACRE